MLTTQIGVNELRIPSRELSTLVIAIAKQKAGNKLPKRPVKKSKPIFLRGIFDPFINATGINTRDDEKMRNAAICEPLKPSLLTFIKINELPQMKQSNTKMLQLINLLFIKRRAKVLKQNEQPQIFYIVK